MKKKPSVIKLLFHLFILLLICTSPLYMINVYRSANILTNKDKFKLKKYRIDSISTGIISSSGLPDETTSYLVFFNGKKEKLKIEVVDKNNISFSKKTNEIFEDFEENILKENGWLGSSASDSINVWQGPNSNLYGLKNEKELDLKSYQHKLIFNILLIFITIISVRYLVKYRKDKKKRI